MLNKEKYLEEIINSVEEDENIAFNIKKHTVEYCRDTDCNYCLFRRGFCSENRKKWLNSEYVEPEVDWSQVPVDMKILVRDDEYQTWLKRYFAKYDNGVVYAWAGGSTLWSAGDSTPMPWKYAKIAEDIKNQEPNITKAYEHF